jgi:hypothetical protein
MTLVGKIFTVLIFVMSIVFMAFSIMVFATHTNWKTMSEGLKSKLTQQEQLNTQAKADHEKTKRDLAQEQASRRQALAALQSKNFNQQTDLDTKTALLIQKESQLNEASAALKSAEERLAALATELTTNRGLLKTAQQERDDIFLQVVALTDKFNQSETTRQGLETRNSQLLAQGADMERVMKAHGLTLETLTAHIPPKVEGIVMDVGESDLIEISIGHDDGLKIGHTLDVYRGNSYLGRIVIRKTAPDRAVGQVVKELKRGQIKKGDHVTTKLS